MESVFIGRYSNADAIPGLECGRDVRVVLHQIDEETFVLSDDNEGACLPDRPIPVDIGKRAMAGELEALRDAGADLEAFFQRPNFKFAK